MFENPRRGRQARNFTTNVSENAISESRMLDLNIPSEWLRNPGKRTSESENPKKFPFAFGAIQLKSSGSTWKLGNRSVFIHPSLHVYSLSISDVKFYLTSLITHFNCPYFKNKPIIGKGYFLFLEIRQNIKTRQATFYLIG